MDNERKYTTSLRLYKERPVHAQAYRCLKNYNRDIFKTKDDFIAEAIIHFSRYLKQEEEEKQTEELNRYLERQNGSLLELITKAVSQVQREQMSEIIKDAVREAVQGIPAAPITGDIPTKETEEADYSEKDIQFAQFYDLEDD